MIRRTLAGSCRLCTIAQHLVYVGGPAQDQGAHFTTDVSSGPSISVEPRVALYDDVVKIALRGFTAREKVTVHGEVIHGEKRILFGSCGQYVADESGQVDLTRQPSHGGTYTGVEPMGVLWSLRPAPGQPQFTRMAINFTDRPGLVSLHTYPGHLDLSDIYRGPETRPRPDSVASVQIERWFRFSDVTRVEIEEGNIRGALFLPPGDGPFQGVIDMFGSSGGLIEYRAALLASRGFATLSLAFFRYKDLPKTFEAVSYDYFEEAVNWFSAHPKVVPGGVGVIGVSKGVEYALSMGTFSPHVSAVVSINGYASVCIGDLMYKGDTLLKCCTFDLSKAELTEDGLDLRNARLNDGDLIPIWQGRAKHLMLLSLDDGQCSPDNFPTLYGACPEEKKKDIEIVRYPGAGHLLEPPYNALCRSSEHKAVGLTMLWGGRPKEHAYAQEDSWRRMLEFLRENIPSPS